MAAEANQLAAQRLREKTPVGSPLNSAEWSQVPLALRDRAFFSAEVEKLRLLQRMQDSIQGALDMVRRGGGDGAYQTRERFIAEMQKLARAEGLDPRNRDATADRSGTLQDITSERRLKLIYDFQQQSAQEYARWKAEQDPAVLAAYPAQEFVRVSARKVPRQNWPERWVQAGGRVYNGRMIALKNDPVWRKLSRFGTPYPPFDFGSGMGLRDIKRKDAEALGLIKPGDLPPKGAEEDFNADLQASIADLNPEYRRLLQQTFGDQIKIDGDTVHWTKQAPSPQPAATVPPTPPSPAPAPTPTPAATPANADEMMPQLAQTRADLAADLDALNAQLDTAKKTGSFDEQTAIREQIKQRQDAAVKAARDIVAIPSADRGAVNIQGKVPTAIAPMVNQGAGITSAYTAASLLPTVAIKRLPSGSRAYYKPNGGQVNVADTSGASTTAHEMTHGTEMQNAAVLAKAKAFLASRIKPGEKPQKLSTLTGNKGYKSTEVAIEDDWVKNGGKVYTGKLYPHATELLSMGIERLHADPALFAEQDPDYFRFVVDTLRGL